MKRKSLSVILTLVTAFVFIAPAHPQEGAGETWEFTIVPHLWVTALGGDVNINDQRSQLGQFVEELSLPMLKQDMATSAYFSDPHPLGGQPKTKTIPELGVPILKHGSLSWPEYTGFWATARPK